MNKENKKFNVMSSNMIITYGYCFIAATHALEQAQKVENGRFYSCMIAGVFAAFTFKAYLNHIGNKMPDWDNLEKTLGHKEKLKLLQKSLGFSADQISRPYKSILDIFYLRDSLAHGKTKTITIDKKVKNHQVGNFEYPQVDWKKLCTLPKAIIMVEDVELMIRLINNQLGSIKDPFAILERSNSYITGLN